MVSSEPPLTGRGCERSARPVVRAGIACQRCRHRLRAALNRRGQRDHPVGEAEGAGAGRLSLRLVARPGHRALDAEDAERRFAGLIQNGTVESEHVAHGCPVVLRLRRVVDEAEACSFSLSNNWSVVPGVWALPLVLMSASTAVATAAESRTMARRLMRRLLDGFGRQLPVPTTPARGAGDSWSCGDRTWTRGTPRPGRRRTMDSCDDERRDYRLRVIRALRPQLHSS